MASTENENDKPALLKAVELVLASPENIKREAESLLSRYRRENPTKSDKELQSLAVEKIISNYSYFAAFSGGATALTGVIPGLGTVIATFGGATADAAICMKLQIEMVMAMACVYGHDILSEEKQRVCYLVAGLGTMSEFGKAGGKEVAGRAFVRLIREHLRGAVLQTIKEIFKSLGLTFSRKALEKAAPFGIGVVIGFVANKGLTWYVGSKAKDFFEIESDEGVTTIDGEGLVG